MKKIIILLTLSTCVALNAGNFGNHVNAHSVLEKDKSLEVFVGKFKMDPPFQFVEITNEETGLFAKETTMPKIAITKVSDLEFSGNGAKFVFVKDKKGKVVGLNIFVKGDELKGTKVKE